MKVITMMMKTNHQPDEDQSSAQEQTDDEHVDPDNVAFICRSCGPDNDFEDIEDRIEQDIVCAYLSIGANLDDPDVCQEVANTVHTQNVWQL